MLPSGCSCSSRFVTVATIASTCMGKTLVDISEESRWCRTRSMVRINQHDVIAVRGRNNGCNSRQLIVSNPSNVVVCFAKEYTEKACSAM